MKPTRGDVFVDGVKSPHAGRRIEECSEKYGYLFQDGAMFDSMNIFDNVAFPLREHFKLSEREIEQRVMQMLSMTGLDAKRVAKLAPNEFDGRNAKRGQDFASEP